MNSKCWTLPTGEIFVGELVCLGQAQKRTERMKTSAQCRKWERLVQNHAMSFAMNLFNEFSLFIIIAPVK